MDSKEFIELIKAHNGTIHYACNKYYCTAANRDDLVQDIILELWKSIGNFKKTCTFNTWVYKIARNVCISALRKHKTKPLVEVIEEYAYYIADESASDVTYIQLEEAMRYESVLNAIEEPYRSLYIMYLEGESYKEMERQTGISENALRARICRISKQLRLRYDSK